MCPSETNYPLLYNRAFIRNSSSYRPTKMNVILFLIVCAAVSIQALPRQRAPIFEIQNGILVRSGQKSTSNLNNHGRIVGGEDADPHSAPHKVSLVRSYLN